MIDPAITGYYLAGAERDRILPADGPALEFGRLLAVAISRYASLIDGLYRGFLDDAGFAGIVHQDLADGQHRNPGGDANYFTTAYFHTPAGLADEVTAAGFADVTIRGVEGPGWPLAGHWRDPVRREQVLFAARAAEHEPGLLGFSAHLMASAVLP